MSELPESKTIKIGDKNFTLSLAKTGVELMSGLKGVASLEQVDGMLFDFGTDTKAIMTPKGLKFPVDLAFVSSEGEIRSITKLDPEFGFMESAEEPIRYAIEAPLGFSEITKILLALRFLSSSNI